MDSDKCFHFDRVDLVPDCSKLIFALLWEKKKTKKNNNADMSPRRHNVIRFNCLRTGVSRNSRNNARAAAVSHSKQSH